ncbi:MAG: hypothetical protein JOZ47_18180 [Kutzneria sp.]|nr:hypothetical protein [Kutzneria sp.]
MRIRTDDEVYRVDAVWLGPPKATFPWRARYVAWGIGLAVFFATLTIERRLGIGFGFFSVAWALVITVVITRLVSSRINHERPLGAVAVMWLRELTAPRERTAGQGGAVTTSRIRISQRRPRRRDAVPPGLPRGTQARQSRRRALPAAVTPPYQSASRQQGARQPSQPQHPQRRQATTRTREVRGVRTPARP